MSRWYPQSLNIWQFSKLTVICFSLSIFLAISFNQNWFGNTLKAQTLNGQEYYVATNGNNNNPGTLEQPFQTIQKCAQVVVAGDTCYIREGIYRESVKPTHSGTAKARITFKPYQNESVTISGADIITNWVQDKDSIYKAAMNWDLGAGNNQVFVDGKMMIEARWPNLTSDISHPAKARVNTASYSKPGEKWSMIKGTITDSNLTQADNFWKGAKINFQGGVAYWTQTGTVTNSEKGKISFDFTFWGNHFLPEEKNPYFLWGTQAALDTSSEWFFEPKSSTLYLWTPQNDNPNNHLVEVKKRQVAFSLADTSYITLENLNVFASTILTNEKSTNIILSKIKATYLSHYTETTKPDHSKIYNTGFIIRGTSNELFNSIISWSAGTGISISGKNHKVYNNVVNDICYSGYECAGIYVIGKVGHEISQNIEIKQNTIENSGRHGLVYNPLNTHDSEPYISNIKITYNRLLNAGLQTPDGGVIYTTGNGGNVEIAYNWIQGYLADTLTYGKSQGAGIYLDVGTSNFRLHHNVILDAVDAIFVNLTGQNIQIYNNTILGKRSSVRLSSNNSKKENFLDTKLINNIFTQRNTGNINAVLLSNNLNYKINPSFKNPQSKNYQLNPDSPAINKGKVLPPYTDGYIGSAPDIGAYEYGKDPWKAGA